MKIVTEKKCIKCGLTKSWTNFSICWGTTEESSFIRRICKGCEISHPPSSETAHMQKELDVLIRRRMGWEKKISDINALIDERLKQIETSKSQEVFNEPE